MDIEITSDFIEETSEQLYRAEHYLLQIEKLPYHMESINSLHRALHTIKGNAGFVGAVEIVNLTHTMEDFLAPYKEQRRAISPQNISLMLESVDALNALVANLRCELDRLKKKPSDVEPQNVDVDNLMRKIKEQEGQSDI